MINKNLIIKNHIPKQYYNINLVKNFSKKFVRVMKEINDNLNKKQTLSVLNKRFNYNFKIEDLTKFRTYRSITIVGMGGSVLGSQAIYFFLKNKIKKKINFIDNLNTEEILNFKKKNNLKKNLFIVISKSGNTVETIINLLSLNVVKKKAKNLIIISEKKNNLLFKLVEKYNLFHIEHKNYIGGRYSVFSEVGMVPAYLMGLDIRKFKKNINIFLRSNKKKILKENAIKAACLLKKKKITNIIYLNYIPKLEKFLFWSQQLIAESLGKKDKGFLPLISNVPKDHHSLLQLYLDGPKNNFFNIFTDKEKSKLKVNAHKYLKDINFLEKKSVSKIINAQKRALSIVLKKKKVPLREFEINHFDEETIGELFSYFILETFIVGKLVDINPFNQPAVEGVKKLTKKILS